MSLMATWWFWEAKREFAGLIRIAVVGNYAGETKKENMQTQSISQASQKRRANKVKRSLVASLSACYMGGICPMLAFSVSHFQAPDLFTAPWTPRAALWLVVAGLLVYSAPLIIAWFSRWVGRGKAVGFTVAMETCMSFTDLYTAIPALLTLIVLNGLILRDKFAND